MSEEVTEALLESLYLLEFKKLFESVYGQKVLRILKPSPRHEAFVGFDQGFAKTRIESWKFIRELADAIAASETKTSSLYVGYFLQYKCPQEVSRASKHMPPGFGLPYYRFPLSLKPNKSSGISQHETLVRLQNIRGTSVAYACPMIFNEDDVQKPPDLDDVRIVPLCDAPLGYLSASQHHVVFQTKLDPFPFWCSEPQEGRSISAQEWLSSLRESFRAPGEFRAMLQEIFRETRKWGVRGIPSSFTVVEFGPPEEHLDLSLS